MPPEGKKIKVLIADGSELIRIYFADIFWINGFENQCELHMACDFEAVESIVADPETRPDVIFLGLSLPKKVAGRIVTDPEYSFEFTHRIKSDPQLRNIKIFIISSHAEKRFEREAEKAKVDRYIYKNQSMPSDIAEVVRGMVEAYQSAA
jgi:CheY-like chemotaxis protein